MISELERRDAKVHRCGGCGTWRYGYDLCTTPGCISRGGPNAGSETQAATQAA